MSFSIVPRRLPYFSSWVFHTSAPSFSLCKRYSKTPYQSQFLRGQRWQGRPLDQRSGNQPELWLCGHPLRQTSRPSSSALSIQWSSSLEHERSTKWTYWKERRKMFIDHTCLNRQYSLAGWDIKKQMISLSSSVFDLCVVDCKETFKNDNSMPTLS